MSTEKQRGRWFGYWGAVLLATVPCAGVLLWAVSSGYGKLLGKALKLLIKLVVTA